MLIYNCRGKVKFSRKRRLGQLIFETLRRAKSQFELLQEGGGPLEMSVIQLLLLFLPVDAPMISFERTNTLTCC